MATTTTLGFSILSRYSGHGVTAARRDLATLRTQMAAINGDLRTHTNLLESIPKRWKAAGAAILAVTPALIPLGAAALQTGAAFTVMAVSVGAALGAYGAALKGAITKTMEMAKAGKALSPVQKEFVSSVDGMKKAWSQFISETQNKTLATATNVVQGLTSGIKLLKPLVDALHPSLLQVSKDFEAWTKGDSAKNYSNLLATIARTTMPLLIRAGKDVINVLGDGFRAFAPLTKSMAQSIADGASALKSWSDGGGFQRFLTYVRDNAPAVKEFWASFRDALQNVFNILKQFSGGVLNVLTDALKAIAAIDPASFKAFANAMLLIKAPLLWLVLNCPPLRDAMIGLLKAMNPQIIYAVAAAFVALRIAFLFMNTALLTTPLGWLILGLTALGVAIVLIATKTTWFQTAWKYTWNFIKTVADAVWNALKIAWTTTVNALITAWQTVSGALTTAWSAVWNAVKTAAQTVWGWLTTGWNAFTSALGVAWNAVASIFQASWNALWMGVQLVAQTVWTALQFAWNLFITTLQIIWTTVSAALVASWNAVWMGIQMAAQAVWTALQFAWNLFITTLQIIWTTVSSALSASWSAVWNALKTAAQAVWTALQTAWQFFLTAVQVAWTTFSGVFQAAWTLLWNAVKLVADTVWMALRLAWQLFLTAIQTAWTLFSSLFQAAWSLLWNAIKTAAETIWNALKTAWETVLNAIKTIWDTVSEALKAAWEQTWNTLKETAVNIWDDIKNAVETGINALLSPINALINGFNSIADAVGLDISIPNISVNFASGGMVGEMPHFAAGGTVNFSQGGGVLNGYAPGRDTVPAVLSRGEGVLVPEAVRGLGGSKFVHWANSHYSNGRGGKRVTYPGYGPKKSQAMGFAAGGVVTSTAGKGSTQAISLGSAEAFHRVRGDRGWGFAQGGMVPSFFQGGGILDPDGTAPGNGGLPGLGGQLPDAPNASNITGKKDDDDGGILGAIKDIASGALDTLLPGGGGVGGMVLGFIGREAFEKVLNPLIDAISANFGPVGEMMAGAAKKIGKALLEYLVKKDEAAKEEYMAKAVAGAQSVSAWAPLAAKALAMAGISAGQLPAFLALMAAESGGNPNAINNWDINAANGVPSQGLMQVIPTTFAAYHVAGTSNNILDPLANMAASANYIKHRYGGVVPGSPYASGTSSATPGIHAVAENGPELVTQPGMYEFGGGEQVFTADQTSAMMAGPATGMVGAAASSGLTASAGGGMGAASAVSTPEGVMELITQLLESSEQLKAAMASMWTQVVSTTNSSWSTMQGEAFTPMNANLTTSIPAAVGATRVVWTAGMTGMATDATTQWTAMNTTAFTPMNAMMTDSVPAAATAMSEGVTGATTSMQTGVQASWTAVEDGTQQSWDNVYTSIDTSVRSATTPINGLLGGFNNVSSALGMGINVPLIAFEMGGMATFATGGMLSKKGGTIPGYSPGRDTFPAMLSPGEGVLTPEAVRGLGGPGFVFAANRKFSGHRGGGKGTSEALSKYTGGTCNHQTRFATGGMSGVMGADGVQRFFSGSITAQVASGLAEAGVSTGMVTQGSFSTGVAASAGTHDGDGVVDLGTTDPGIEQRLRDVGWAAWIRGNGDGMSPHMHAVLMRATGIAPGAMGQVIDFINGGTGLGAGSSDSGTLAGWGLGLGEWNFGPLLKSIVDGQKTTVPPRLKPLVLKKLNRAQVENGFAGLKSILDATDMGTGMWADGLRGTGNKTHSGIVDHIASNVAGASFDEGGMLQPGYTLAFNGTGKPEPVGHDLVPRGSGKIEVNMPITINGNANAQEVVDGINSQVLPKLRRALNQGTGING